MASLDGSTLQIVIYADDQSWRKPWGSYDRRAANAQAVHDPHQNCIDVNETRHSFFKLKRPFREMEQVVAKARRLRGLLRSIQGTNCPAHGWNPEAA